MTSQPEPSRPIDLAEVAGEPTEQAVADEREAVGDHADTGPDVTPDDAQSPPA